MPATLASHPGTTVRRDRTFSGYGGRTIDLKDRAAAVKQVSEADLALIQSYALREVGADEVRVYEANVANNQVDRDNERFSEEILQDFAETLPGKSVLIGHQWGPPGVGRVFKALLVQQDDRQWLRASFFIPKLGNEKLINDIDLGVATWVSIGFYAPDRVEIIGKDGQPVYREYRRGPNGERGEAIELSFVFLGAQYDAAVIKGVMRELGPKLARPEGARALATALGVKDDGAKPDTVEPDSEGRCPEGYELGEDGLCHLMAAGRAYLPFSVHGRSLGKAAKDRPWDPDVALKRVRAWASSDGSGEASKIDWAKYAQAFAWRDPQRRTALAGYRFLHHDVEQGHLVHHFEGTVRAMAALFSRNSALEDADRRGVWEHLAAEYRVFGEEPPAWEVLEELGARARRASDAEVESVEAEIAAKCRATRGAWARFLELVQQAAKTVFGSPDLPVPEGTAPRPEPSSKQDAGGEQEGDMDPKVVEQLHAALNGIDERLKTVSVQITDLKGAVDAVQQAQKDLGERVDGLAEDVKMLEEAGMKLVERVEDLERSAGMVAAKAEPDEEGATGGDSQPNKGAGKSATSVFGLLITPDPLKARRAAALNSR